MPFGTEILPAEVADASSLCVLATLAFIEDARYRPKSAVVEGPPGHADLAVHANWIREKVYLKYLVGSHIVAGSVISVSDDRGEIELLFVGPEHMNKGVGHALVEYVCKTFAQVQEWTLQTPDYATRNHAFYESLGFVCTHKTPAKKEIGFGFHHYKWRALAAR